LHLGEKRELVCVNFEQVECFREQKWVHILVYVLVQVLVENWRYEADLFSTIDDAMPGLALKHNRFVLELGPNRQVEGLEGQKFVQHRVLIVLLQSWRLEHFEVEEGDAVSIVLRIILNTL